MDCHTIENSECCIYMRFGNVFKEKLHGIFPRFVFRTKEPNVFLDQFWKLDKICERISDFLLVHWFHFLQDYLSAWYWRNKRNNQNLISIQILWWCGIYTLKSVYSNKGSRCAPKIMLLQGEWIHLEGRQPCQNDFASLVSRGLS